MTYKTLKLLIVVATFFVWVQLFVGAVQTLNSATKKASDISDKKASDASNKQIIATDNTH